MMQHYPKVTLHAAIALAGTIVAGPCSVVRAQLPATDIFVASVEGQAITDVRRVTERDAYDNQPMFLPGGEQLLYSSEREVGTDIYLYDLETGRHRPVAETPESEYSPTPMPGGSAISVVRDYGDLKQQLWAFPLDGTEPRLLLPDVNPVGYHAWVDDERLVLFVLGEPETLQLARVGRGEGRVLASSPGRALARVPGRPEMSFVDKSDDTQWWLTAIDPASGETRRLMPTMASVEDYVWAPDGAVWAGKGSRLYRRDLEDDEWRQVADLEAKGVRNISRLSFSSDGRSLAMVANHAQPVEARD